jgi:hypothetical protein
MKANHKNHPAVLELPDDVTSILFCLITFQMVTLRVLDFPPCQYHCSTFFVILILLLSEGQAGEAGEHSKKAGEHRIEKYFTFFMLQREPNDLYSSPTIIRVIKSRRMIWTGHVARMGEKRGAYRILVGRPEGRRQLGRPRRRWMILNWFFKRWDGGMNWIELAQNRGRWRAVVNVAMNLRVP